MSRKTIVEIILKAIDKASGPVGRIGKAFGKLGGPLKAIRGLAEGTFRALGVGITGLGGMFTAAIAAAASFEQKMSGVEATLGATAAQMLELNQEALRLGKITIFSADEAAAGLEILARSGIEFGDIMGGAGQATLDLAAAASTDLVTAAGVASAAINAFGLEGSEMARVADITTAAINKSDMTITDFRFAMQQGAATASQLNVSYEDMSITLAALARKFLRGERAGTGMHVFLTKTIPQTKKAAEAMEKYGLIVDGNNQFFDEQTGEFKDMQSVVSLLERSFGDLSTEQRLVALTTIFGSRAQRVANRLIDTGAEGYRELAESMKDVSAQDVAETRMNNLKGAVEKFLGEVETAGINIGRIFLPALTEVFQGLETFVSKFQTPFQRLGDAAQLGLEPLKEALASVFGAETAGMFSSFMDKAKPVIDFLEGLKGGGDVSRKGMLSFEFDDSAITEAESTFSRLKQTVKDTFVNFLGEDTVTNLIVVKDGVIAMLPLLAGAAQFVLGFAAGFATLATRTKETTDFMRNIPELLGEIGSMFADVQSEEWDRFIGSFSEFGSSLRSMWDTSSEVLGEMKAGFEESTGAWATSVDESVLRQLESADKWNSEMSEKINTGFTEMKDTVFGKMQEIETNFGEKTATMLATATEWLTRQGELVRLRFDAFLRDVKTKMKSILDEQSKKWEEVFNKTKDQLIQLGDEIATKYENFRSSVADKMERLRSVSDEKWAAVVSEGSSRLTALQAVVAEKWGAVKDTVVTKASEILATVQTWLTDQETKVRTGLQNLVTAAGEKWGEIKTEIATKAGEIISDVVGYGEDIVDGLKEGWDNKIEALKTAVRTGLQAILDLIKNIFGPFFSPSRKMRQFGQWMAEGLAQGWDKGVTTHSTRIERAAKGIGKGIRISLEQGLVGQGAKKGLGAGMRRSLRQSLFDVPANMPPGGFIGEAASSRPFMDPKLNTAGRGGFVAASSVNFWRVWARQNGVPVPDMPPPFTDPKGDGASTQSGLKSGEATINLNQTLIMEMNTQEIMRQDSETQIIAAIRADLHTRVT